MSRPRPDRCMPARHRRRGFTLAELLIAMTITSMLSVVLGGIVMAVETAWQYSAGLEDATTQASAALERLRYMVSHAGVYRTSDGMTPGIAVVEHRVGTTRLPDVLVIWSGGRHGGLRSDRPHERLPRIDELVFYTCRPGAPEQLVEITIPGNTNALDFRADNFGDTVRQILASEGVQAVLLCDRIRTSAAPTIGFDGPAAVGNVRFELIETPSDEDLNQVMPGGLEWYGLAWAQGIVGRDWGLRQITLRIELQVETRLNAPSGTATTTTSVPFFGSATYRYAYRP